MKDGFTQEQLQDCLDCIPCSSLNYEEWLAVGMALKTENMPCSMWETWSASDPSRYKEGECAKKWDGFTSENVTGRRTGATIVDMAKNYGYIATGNSSNIIIHAMNWDDDFSTEVPEVAIPKSYDAPTEGDREDPYSHKWYNVEELKLFLKTLFKKGDIVGFGFPKRPNEEQSPDEEAGLKPNDRPFFTVDDVIERLERYGEFPIALCDTKRCGAWVQMNPLDGNGVKRENVKEFRYALIECDTIPLAEQEKSYRQLKLPIKAMVYSGGKSIHAIVHIGAENAIQYRERVGKLYAFLKKNDVPVDEANKNADRMTRLPGCKRGVNFEHWQRLLGTNIGCKNWTEFEQYIDGRPDSGDVFPLPTAFGELEQEDFIRPPELIHGILRRGHKMLISSDSKAGKSFALMELSIAVAEGGLWFNKFQCECGKVLYVNLEIDAPSANCRFQVIFDRLGIEPTKAKENLVIWNLRGHAVPMDQLADKIITQIQGKDYALVIVDPIYKVLIGDENSATDMGKFCNQFDRICTETKCSVIYCHHHAKGQAGSRKTADRASGSGVFARDPDAILDLTELTLPIEEYKKKMNGESNRSAWRLEMVLREFANQPQTNIWFDYPIHYVDEDGELDECKVASAQTVGASNLDNSYKRQGNSKISQDEFDNIYDKIKAEKGKVMPMDLQSALGIVYNTVVKTAEKYGYTSGKRGEIVKE